MNNGKEETGLLAYTVSITRLYNAAIRMSSTLRFSCAENAMPCHSHVNSGVRSLHFLILRIRLHSIITFCPTTLNICFQ